MTAGIATRDPDRGALTYGAVVLLLSVGGCAPNVDVEPNAASGVDQAVEFHYDRRGGLCATPGGGGLCSLSVVVRDDGTWSADGLPTPAPASGGLVSGAASELAAAFEAGWEELTARPFTGVCPTAFDGSEVTYTVRRIPTGPGAPFADAIVRSVSSCVHDLDHAGARRVLSRLDGLWGELALPR